MTGTARKWLKRIIFIVIGCIVLGMLLIFVAGIVSFAVMRKSQSNKLACFGNLRHLSIALAMYAEDHGQHFPPEDRWNEALLPYYKNRNHFICPAVGGSIPSYGMNSLMAARKTTEVKAPANVPALFDSSPGANRSGGSELLPCPGRHSSYNNVGFVDGHVGVIWDSRTLVWSPSAAPPEP